MTIAPMASGHAEDVRNPKIIQGGMGVAVSDWRLARAVSLTGQLGVVSGTGIDTVLVRRLQLGDASGLLKLAFDQFPIQEVAQRIWKRYFVAGGKAADAPFLSKPVYTFPLKKAVVELIMLANFVEVFLAKRDQPGIVGINLLEKIQIGTLPSLLGAMMAGVDYVLMGAGIPRQIPAVLDRFAEGSVAEVRLDVADDPGHENVIASLDPAEVFPGGSELRRPRFLAIVSSSALAATLARKSTPPPDGFVLEGWTAGGHNAPPRGAMQLDDLGQPIYGERDVPDLLQIRDLGLPFWMAGSFGSGARLKEAQALGAEGIQVGTAFAFCEESGMDVTLKNRILKRIDSGEATVHTDPKASPTGFPFKVVDLPDTLSEEDVYEARSRVCDLGYLRQLYRKADGTLGYRCAAEPIEDFVKKGGTEEEAKGRKCLCNSLMSTVGLGQMRKDGPEPAIATAGDNLHSVTSFLKPGSMCYSAEDVISRLLDDVD